MNKQSQHPMEHNYARVLDLKLDARNKRNRAMTRSIEPAVSTGEKLREVTKSFLDDSLINIQNAPSRA
jgi:hypothetical protein